MAEKLSLDAIKTLREKTGVSLKEVRVALEASGGDASKALELLKARGAQVAQGRQGRATGQGRVESYVHHNGRLGALVEVNCETDFVARTPEFVDLCREIAMQVAAMGPRYLRLDDAPPAILKAEAASLCLLEQPLVKDPGTTVGQRLTTVIGKTGENIVIHRFMRFAVGEAAPSAS